MNLTLCGIGIPFESQNYEKVTANRIHAAQKQSRDLSSWSASDIADMLTSKINDCQGVLRAVDAGTVRDINKNPIDRVVIKKELLILAKDVKSIERAVAKRFNIGTENSKVLLHDQPLSFREKCIELENLAKEMIFKAIITGNGQAASLMLLGTTDGSSILSTVPKDVVNFILRMGIQIEQSQLQQMSSEIKSVL